MRDMKERFVRRTDRELHGKEDCASILQKADTCHLALLDGGRPYVVALNYGFVWTGALPVLYFHCARTGKKLDLIAANGSAFFTADTDHVLVSGETDCEWGMNFASVAGEGTVSVVDDRNEQKTALDSLMNHYTGRTEFVYDERVFGMTTILKMTLTTLTGKRKSS